MLTCFIFNQLITIFSQVNQARNLKIDRASFKQNTFKLELPSFESATHIALYNLDLYEFYTIYYLTNQKLEVLFCWLY